MSLDELRLGVRQCEGVISAGGIAGYEDREQETIVSIATRYRDEFQQELDRCRAERNVRYLRDQAIGFRNSEGSCGVCGYSGWNCSCPLPGD